MILTEEHIIHCRKNDELFRRIDDYCYRSKNLYNSVNYLIRQCSRISRLLAQGEILTSREKYLICRINCALSEYNASRKGKDPLPYVDENNGFIADAYFLSWHLKSSTDYKAMPYATCAQICIQDLCRDWKSFYKGMKTWHKHPENMLGRPQIPGYKDKKTGRNAITLTSQNISVNEDGEVRLPEFLSGIRLKERHKNIRQVRLITEGEQIHVHLMYKAEEVPATKANGIMGIDPGVNNLLTLCMSTQAEPMIICGKNTKSINHYYNKKTAELQSSAQKANGKYRTKRMERISRKRGRKIKDQMHKVSREVIRISQRERIGVIVIGNNQGWKQESNMGKVTNQNFVQIPYYQLIHMITYKAKLEGIKVIVISEAYTSGTSYPDMEAPEKKNYNPGRRVTRGTFRSNTGLMINADVNAGYQIIRKAGYKIPFKGIEKVTKIKVS